jgi:hypothetical protein
VAAHVKERGQPAQRPGAVLMVMLIIVLMVMLIIVIMVVLMIVLMTMSVSVSYGIV